MSGNVTLTPERDITLGCFPFRNDWLFSYFVLKRDFSEGKKHHNTHVSVKQAQRNNIKSVGREVCF